jgi:hypothetical protein
VRPEDVPQRWRTLMIGAMQEAFDDNMMARHYADIERMVDEGLAAVAPLIRRAALEEAAGMVDAAAQEYQAEPDGNLVAETEGTTDIVLMVFNEVAAAIRALDA